MVAPDSKDRSRSTNHRGLRLSERKHRYAHPHFWGLKYHRGLRPSKRKHRLLYPSEHEAQYRSTESTTLKMYTDQTISLPPSRAVRLADQRYTQSHAISAAL